MADQDDDIPPLEDMSEMFGKLKLKQQQAVPTNKYLEPCTTRDDRAIKRVENLLDKKEHAKPKESSIKSNEKTKQKKQADTFCGFKKGFLTSSNKSSTKEKPVPTTTPSLPEIRKNASDDVNKNVLPDVQDAMKSQAPLLNNTDWVTDDLMKTIMTHPKLSKQFNDPRFSNAISQFQENPQKVMAMCEENVELREFIQTFCGVMGEHFTNLADHQEEKTVSKSATKPKNTNTTTTKSNNMNTTTTKETKEDREKMQEILSDPEVTSILQTKEIQTLFHLLRTDPNKASRMLKSADYEQRRKIQKLIDVGLLQFSA